MGDQVKPADLRPGHRIVCDMPGFEDGLTVIADPEVRSGVAVDVKVADTAHEMDTQGLPAAVQAESLAFLALNPLRYRLYFHPDPDVAVED